MKNPWLELPARAPYVLAGDRPHVEAFNRLDLSQRYRLNLNLLPVPFSGNRAAPLVVLGLNPSYQADSARLERGRSARARALRQNLADGPDGVHVGLAAEFSATGGSRWWNRCFRAVHAQGPEFEDLSLRVLAVEFHGYRSQSWRAIPITLPSQYFGFELVKQAIAREATIVVMRGRRAWEVAVPELLTYRRTLWVRNTRSASISPRNLGTQEFDLVLEALNPRSGDHMSE